MSVQKHARPESRGVGEWFINIVSIIYSNAICLPAIVLLTCLFMLNITLTATLTHQEQTLYVQDSVPLKFFMIFATVVLIAVLRQSGFIRQLRQYLADDDAFAHVKRIMVVVIAVLGVFWALSTQFTPGVDEERIVRYAYDATQGDFTYFAPGEYMNRHPNNYGVFLLDYVITVLFGGNNYLVFEVFNALAVAVVFYELNEIGGLLGLGRVSRLCILISGIAFFPVMLYVTMIYGNLLGLAFALLATRKEMEFFEEEDLRQAICCAVAMALSMFFKSTCLIYLAAILIAAVVYPIATRNPRAFMLPVIILIAHMVQSRFAEMAVESITGYKMVEPASTIAWIAMGLQESDLAPGWWNAYVFDSYSQGGSTTAGQAALAAESIRQSIAKFSADPDYAASFFVRKIASTWSNPSFQCFGTYRTGSYIHHPRWLQLMFTFNGQRAENGYLDAFTTLVYFGALVRVVLNRGKKMRHGELTIYMMLVGAFIYLLLSETKARYALLFFVALIPVGFAGLIDLANLMMRAVARVKQGQTNVDAASLRGCVVSALAVCVSLALFATVVAPACSEYIERDTPYYREYLAGEDMDAGIVPYIGYMASE